MRRVSKTSLESEVFEPPDSDLERRLERGRCPTFWCGKNHRRYFCAERLTLLGEGTPMVSRKNGRTHATPVMGRLFGSVPLRPFLPEYLDDAPLGRQAQLSLLTLRKMLKDMSARFNFLKTKAKIARNVYSAGTLPWLGFERVQAKQILLTQKLSRINALDSVASTV
jgi:hypothetical protein